MKIIDFEPQPDVDDPQYLLQLTNETFSTYQAYSERISQLSYDQWESMFNSQKGSLRVIFLQDISFLQQLVKQPYSRICYQILNKELPTVKTPILGDIIRFNKGFGIVININRDDDKVSVGKIGKQSNFSFITSLEFQEDVQIQELKPFKYVQMKLQKEFIDLIKDEQFLYSNFQIVKQVQKNINLLEQKVQYFISRFAIFNMYEQSIMFYTQKQRQQFQSFFENNGYYRIDPLQKDEINDTSEKQTDYFLFQKQLSILNSNMITFARQLYLGEIIIPAKKVILKRENKVSKIKPILEKECYKVENILFNRFLSLYQFLQWHTDIIDIEQLNLIQFIESFYWQKESNRQQLNDTLLDLNSEITDDNKTPDEIMDPLPCFYPLYNNSVIPYHFKIAYNCIRLLVKGHYLEAEYIHNNYGENSFEDESSQELSENIQQVKKQKKTIHFNDSQQDDINDIYEENLTDQKGYYLPNFLDRDIIQRVNFEKIKTVKLNEDTRNFQGSRDDLWTDVTILYINQTMLNYQDLQATNEILPILAFLTNINLNQVFEMLFRFEIYFLEKQFIDYNSIYLKKQSQNTSFPYNKFISLFKVFNIDFELTQDEIDYLDQKLDYNSVRIRHQYIIERFRTSVSQKRFIDISIDDQILFYEWLFYQVSQSDKQAQYEQMIEKWISENYQQQQVLDTEQTLFFSQEVTQERDTIFKEKLNELLFKKLQLDEKLLARPHFLTETALNNVNIKITNLKEQNTQTYHQNQFQLKRQELKDDQLENTYKMNQGFLCEEEAQFYVCNINEKFIGFATHQSNLYLIPESKTKILAGVSSVLKEHFTKITLFQNPVQVTQFPKNKKKWIYQQDCTKLCQSYHQLPIFLRTVDELNLSRENTETVANLFQ